jgi:hypothetical protein
VLLVEFANALVDLLQSYRVAMPHRSAPVGRKTVAVEIDDVDVDYIVAPFEPGVLVQ